MKNNMILNCKVPKKILKSLMLVAALFMIIPVSARLQKVSRFELQEQDDGEEVVQRPSQGRASASRRTTAASARSRGAQRRSPQGRYATTQRTRQQQLKQPVVKKQTEQKITPPAGGGVPAPGSQETGSTDKSVDAETWQKLLDDVLKDADKEPTVILEDIQKIREKLPTLTDRQKMDLGRLERMAKLEIELANLKSQQSGQPAAGAEAEKPQQQEQAGQPTAPAGGGTSMLTVRTGTNPFLAQQAPATEQQAKPVVTTETKPTRQGPIQKWLSEPWSETFLGLPISNAPKPTPAEGAATQTPQAPAAPAAEQKIDPATGHPVVTKEPEKKEGAFKQWLNSPWGNTFLGLPISNAPKQTTVQPAAAPAQPQPAAISEEVWKNVKEKLLAQQPSQELIDKVEDLKKNPRLSDIQRGELEKFQQSIREYLSNPSLQTPTPPATVPLVLPPSMPSNPFVATKVAPKVQPPTVENPFSLPQKQSMSEEVWKKIKTDLAKSAVRWSPEALMNRIEKIKKDYSLNNEQRRWLEEFGYRNQPLSVPVQQQNPIPAPTVENPFSRPQQQVGSASQPIDEESWKKVQAGLVAASQNPSQKLVDQIEKMKKHPRLTQLQRDQLESFKQIIKNRLLNQPVPGQKFAPLTGRPIPPKSNEPGPLQKLLPDWSAFY